MVKVSSIGIIDLDATLAANSDSRVPSQKAVKTYADEYKPRIGELVFPNRIINSSGIDRDIWFTGGHLYDVSPVTSAIGDTMVHEFFVHGSETVGKISIILSKTNTRGIVNLYINGDLEVSNIDLYASSPTTYQLILTPTSTLRSGEYNTLSIVVTGKNTSSSGYSTGSYGMRYY